MELILSAEEQETLIGFLGEILDNQSDSVLESIYERLTEGN